jgi:AcrR family transcriptional regulator
MRMTSNPASRQTRRFEQKREAILDAAAWLFNEKGLKGTTLSDVAQRVGLITNSVTYYYRKKEELATACLLRSIAVLEDLIATASREATAEARLRQVLRLYFGALAETETNDRAPLMVFSDMRALTSPHVELVFDTYNQMYRRLRALLQEGDAGAVSRMAQNARAHLVLSLMHGARHWIDHYEADDYVRVADRIADILIAGLAGPHSQWKPIPLPAIVWPSADAISPEAFLRSATILINEQGYRGASVEKISARLHVTKGSFYHHNDNKDDLVAACFERTFAVIRQAQKAAETAGSNSWDSLCASCRELVRFQLTEHGPLLRNSAFMALPAELRDQKKRVMDRLANRFGIVVADGIVDGSIRPVDPTVAAHLIDSMINAAVELERWISGVTVENAADLYARPFFVGIFKPQTEATS